MAGKKNKPGGGGANGYHDIDADAVISVDEVTRQAEAMAEGVSLEKVAELANNAPFVSIEHLNAGYGKMEILHDFNMQVARKQSLCLIGPNGAGKSTILHSIFGFTNIFGGKILVGDGDDKRDITALSSSEKLKNAGIAYILQDKSVFPNMTALENVRIALQRRRGDSFDFWRSEKVLARFESDAQRLLADVGLTEFAATRAAELPYGRKRALEIATTLALDPEMLLLDEPMAGMGREDVERIAALIRRVSKNRTILMVEHNLSVVADLSDRITVLARGEILAEGDYAAVSRSPEVIEAYIGADHE